MAERLRALQGNVGGSAPDADHVASVRGRILDTAGPALGRCHRTASAGPRFEPTVRIRVELSATGQTLDASVLHSTHPQKYFEDCLLAQVRSVVHDGPGEPTYVDVELTFVYATQ